jgi:hypothetical protein
MSILMKDTMALEALAHHAKLTGLNHKALQAFFFILKI